MFQGRSALITLTNLAGAFIFLCAISDARAEQTNTIPDFTFIHASDVHAPRADSKLTISRIPSIGEINLAPFSVKVEKPSFAIVTGDTTEFGGGSGWWEEYISYWKNIGMPVYHGIGNHDNTWHANIKPMRDIGRGPYYSFEEHGCHFVALMSATAQDPRPSFGEEQILWLKEDLAKMKPNTPVFVFFHHPLEGLEFASRYDWDRLLDVLREFNTVLILAGHTHNFEYYNIKGVSQMTGGSTFGPNSGFAIVSVKDGVLRAAYWKTNEPAPTEKLFQKTIPTKVPFQKMEITSPGFRASVTGAIPISAEVFGVTEMKKATYTIDDEVKGDLTISSDAHNWTAAGSVETGNLLPGAHYLRVEFTNSKRTFARSTEFFLDPPNSRLAWRTYLAASSKVTPALAEGLVYVGANDGKLRAFEGSTGKELWSVETGAEILAEPLVANGNVYSANGLGVVAAFSKTGKKLWSFTAADAVYSGPVLSAGKIIFGSNDGKLYALDAATGTRAWNNSDAIYSIESKPFVWNEKIYFGAWDQFVRCVDARNGRLIWKQSGEGSLRPGPKRYFSPGDAMPVVAEGKLMIADRAYKLTMLNANTGQSLGAKDAVAATGISENGKFVYLRKIDGKLAKIDSTGKQLWSVPAQLGAIPTAPLEKNGVVYVCSGKGTLSAVAASSGKILWQYQVSPQLFVMSSVSCDGTNAYVTAFDGTLTALKCATP